MNQTFDSVCPLDCPDSCSLAVTVEDNRVVRLDGSHRNPITDGYICSKVRRYAERVYSPLRILTPQRRIGAKGDGHFEPISWSVAIELIAERFRTIIAEDGPEAILPYHYGGSSGLLGEGALDQRFFHRLGASELVKAICAAPTGAVYRAMYGAMAGVPPDQFENAKFILLWGVNPAATSIHLREKIQTARKNGAFVAVIDPRVTPMARNADLHLAPRPGTDVVLALAMIHELVRSNRADREFLARDTNGFDALADAASTFSVERAAEVCDVSAESIRALVDRYSGASPAVLRCGWGVERNRNGGNAVRAILALPAVAGKFGTRGGGVTMSLGGAFPIDKSALARPDLRRAPVRKINMVQLGRVLTEPQNPPVRALFVYNANPMAVTPDQNRIRRGLMREDLFTVVHEQVMTDTARYADLLLPATTFLEQAEMKKAYGHFHLQYADPVISPVGEALSNSELFRRLSRAMEFDEPELQASDDEVLTDALNVANGRFGANPMVEIRESKRSSLRFGEDDEPVQFVSERPTTATGKIELYPIELGTLEYRTPPESSFPLTLLSPASDRLINSIFGEFQNIDSRIAIHPDDARRRGIVNDAAVRVHNDLGEVHVNARVTDEVRPGVVSMPKGLWSHHTANGSTTTALIADDLTDIADGACFNDAHVEVEVVCGAAIPHNCA